MSISSFTGPSRYSTDTSCHIRSLSARMPTPRGAHALNKNVRTASSELNRKD
jgi:hypothetical protein